MAERIPQSVAYLVVFRAFLAADGKTPATGKTIAVTISKNGATSFSNPAAGATNATEMASGFYKFTLAAGDTGTLGPLAWRGANVDINDAGDLLTVVNANNAGFVGVPDAVAGATGGLPLGDSAGQVTVGTVAAAASNIKKNTALANFEFLMTDSTTHAPKTGVTVTATRSLDGAAFAACANAVAELSNGIYKINLAAGDLNANVVTLRFTGTASDDLLITIVTQP
jgi:hypothetical protein